MFFVVFNQYKLNTEWYLLVTSELKLIGIMLIVYSLVLWCSINSVCLPEIQPLNDAYEDFTERRQFDIKRIEKIDGTEKRCRFRKSKQLTTNCIKFVKIVSLHKSQGYTILTFIPVDDDDGAVESIGLNIHNYKVV
uniref:Uncharacterized protein n=1 Tax=Glossina austeni TaxID=7395 RepID=A0A1A9VB21_GLOAU